MKSLANTPAYPFTPSDRSGQTDLTRSGMTLRQHYAGLALQGLLANSFFMEKGGEISDLLGRDGLAIMALSAADSLIKELSKA